MFVTGFAEYSTLQRLLVKIESKHIPWESSNPLKQSANVAKTQILKETRKIAALRVAWSTMQKWNEGMCKELTVHIQIYAFHSKFKIDDPWETNMICHKCKLASIWVIHKNYPSGGFF